MMKCNLCGKTILVEQVPEVHISEVEMLCGDPNCNGKATYRNNKSSSGNSTVNETTNILTEDLPGINNGKTPL